MTTSISSEDVWNYKIYEWTTENWNGVREIAFPCFSFQEWMFIYEKNEHKKNRTIYQLGPGKIAFPPNLTKGRT